MKFNGSILLILFSSLNAIAQTIYVNEVVSSNHSTIQDCDGDYSDWIELYNPNDFTINLLGYYLSDDTTDVQKWSFPNVEIGAHSYYIVFASGKDKIEEDEIHANFKVSQYGEYILFSDATNIMDQIAPVYLNDNTSIARISFENKELLITSNLTPLSQNLFSNPVYSSHPSGFYEAAFNLELISLDDDCQIRYTTTGEMPTMSSHLYSEPLFINQSNNASHSISAIPTTPLDGPYQLNEYVWEPPQNVHLSNVLRFAAFKDSAQVGDGMSKSFFIKSEFLNEHVFNIVSLVTDSLNLFDYEKGIYVPGKQFDEFGFNWFPQGNYHLRGEAHEREVNVTFFDVDGEIVFDTQAGIRMRGYSSAAFPQKSFNMYFRSDYGKSHIKYPLFEGSRAEKHKRIIFRNSGGDFHKTHFRDVMLHQVIAEMGIESQAYRPISLFINGEYWGIHNLREKYDEYYFKYNYGLDEDSITIVGVCGDVEEGDGDSSDYVDLLDFVGQNDLSLSENFSYVKDQVDIDNFIDFQIAEIYFANYDWPCNNYKVWRSTYQNSKWRFLIYDLDRSFGSGSDSDYNVASMEHSTSTQEQWPYCECSNVLFRKLLKNEEFKSLFVQRFMYHVNNTFDAEKLNELINDFELMYTHEMKSHIERWNYPQSTSAWMSEIQVLKDFAKKRPCYMVSNLKSYFNTTNIDFNCLNLIDDQNIDFLVTPNPSTGLFLLTNISGIDILNGTLRIMNYKGQVIHQKNNIKVNANDFINIDLSNLLGGVYIVLLNADQASFSAKVIKN